jgi:hypothetical protein
VRHVQVQQGAHRWVVTLRTPLCWTISITPVSTTLMNHSHHACKYHLDEPSSHLWIPLWWTISITPVSTNLMNHIHYTGEYHCDEP